MAFIDSDAVIEEELAALDDYQVLPRPQTLIDMQTSASKVFSSTEGKEGTTSSHAMFDSGCTKLIDTETAEEKRSSRKRDKKDLKVKSIFKSSSKVRKKSYNSTELDKKFHEIVKTVDPSRKNKSDSVKTSSDEQASIRSKSPEADKLLAIMNEPAASAKQRYEALNAKDSLIRLRENKKEGGNKKIVGCCPDMCPEKERYSRIAKNCLSILEMSTSPNSDLSSRDADHSLMVKEYSRSSADQQEPLPHELRPVSVLKSTMDYLICNIMDISVDKVSLADWYDFIWNRTRSIRKDITQQQLCDIDCVDIIEKCVRFHIHCAEALSEEDTAIFDPKINNENLTKCLQTLKHMYQDLQSKGIQCPNEAEFRAYDILLSLTEGETLRLVKDIRKDIFKSPAVKSAYEAAIAFKSDNYVKFFNLIEKASYLNSCILHRYVLEARNHALQIMVKAYCTPQSSTMYPTSALVNNLKFEDAKEACEFCKLYGLEADEENVVIDRKQFSRYPSGLLPSRTYSLVEKKKAISLGMIINNEPLPRNPLETYVPQNSFDEQNMLKRLVDVKPNEENISVDNTATKVASLTKATHKVESVFHQSKFSSSNLEDLEAARKVLIDKLNKFQSLAKKPKEQNKVKLKRSKKDDLNKSDSKEATKSLKSSRDSRNRVSNKSDDEEVSKSEPHPVKKTHGFKFGIESSCDESSNSYFAKNDFSYRKKESVKSPESNDFKLSVDQKRDEQFNTFFGRFKDLPDKTQNEKNVQQPVVIGLPKLSSVFNVTTATPSSFFQTFSKGQNMDSSKSLVAEKNSVAFSFQQTAFKSTASENSFKITPTPNIPVTSVPLSKSEPEKELPELPFTHVEPPDSTTTLPLQSFSAKLDETGKEPFLTGWSTDPNVSENSVEDFVPEESESKDAEETHDEPRKESVPTEWLMVHHASEDSTDELMSIESETKQDPEEAMQILREEKITAVSTAINDAITTECIQEILLAICKDIVAEEKNRQDQLNSMYEEVRKNLIKKTILKWKHFCERKQQRREFENSTLCSPWQPMLINIPYAITGVVSPMTVYKKQQSLSQLTADKLKKRYQTRPGWEVYKAQELCKTNNIKLHGPVYYFSSNAVDRFFKLCVVFPVECSDVHLVHFSEWICAKFGLPKPADFEFSACRVHATDETHHKSVYSITAIKYDAEKPPKFYLDGISAMILCVPTFQLEQEFTAFLDNFEQFTNLQFLENPYPLLVYQVSPQTSLETSDNLAEFLRRKDVLEYFSSTKLCVISDAYNYSENSSLVLESLNWLDKNACPYPELHCCVFQHYLEDAFTFAFNVLLCKMSLPEYELLKIMPNVIIQFYNKVFEFRSSILSSDLITSMQRWPPEELVPYLDGHFINYESQRVCQDVMRNVLLPEYNGNADGSDLWEYVDEISTLAASDNDVLFLRIKNAIENNVIPDWILIINICALHLISVQPAKYFSYKMCVFYAEEDLENFESDQFWQDVQLDIRNFQSSNSKRKECDLSTNSPLKKTKFDDLEEESLPSILEGSDSEDYLDPSGVPDSFNQQRAELLMPLQAAFEKQKEESEAFQLLLNSSVVNENYSKSTSRDESLFGERKNDSNVSSINSSAAQFDFLQNKSANGSSQFNTSDIDYLHKSLLEKSTTRNSLSSMFDRITELKYNIQKSTILEDHFDKLLSNQV